MSERAAVSSRLILNSRRSGSSDILDTVSGGATPEMCSRSCLRKLARRSRHFTAQRRSSVPSKKSAYPKRGFCGPA